MHWLDRIKLSQIGVFLANSNFFKCDYNYMKYLFILNNQPQVAIFGNSLDGPCQFLLPP